MVESLGADTVIDYTQEDFTQSDQKYDVIFDTVGKLAPAQDKKTLKEYGIYLIGAPSVSVMGVSVIITLMSASDPRGDRVTRLCTQAGKLGTHIHPFPTDSRYPAHRFIEDSRAASTRTSRHC